MEPRKRIALVAHDNRKPDLVEWTRWNAGTLCRHDLTCTGTTGRLIGDVIEAAVAAGEAPALERPIRLLRSGPLGGDQQLGALIAEGGIDVLIFFWDPMQPQPHDVDVKALLRIAVLCDTPVACNRATADFLISSPLIDRSYDPAPRDDSAYLEREL